MKTRRFHLETIALLPVLFLAIVFIDVFCDDCAGGVDLQRNSSAATFVH